MNKSRKYILIVTIIISVGLSFYSITQSFFSQISENKTARALPLMVPALILIIPIIIILGTIVTREIRYKKTIANGVKSVGFIRKVIQTGTSVRKNPEIKMELDVLDENENKFFGEVTTVVRDVELDFLKVGEPVPVIYKINNKKEIAIDRKPDVAKLKDRIEAYKAQNNIG